MLEGPVGRERQNVQQVVQRPGEPVGKDFVRHRRCRGCAATGGIETEVARIRLWKLRNVPCDGSYRVDLRYSVVRSPARTRAGEEDRRSSRYRTSTAPAFRSAIFS